LTILLQIERHTQITNTRQWNDINPVNRQLDVSDLFAAVVDSQAKINEQCFISVYFKAVRRYPTE